MTTLNITQNQLYQEASVNHSRDKSRKIWLIFFFSLFLSMRNFEWHSDTLSYYEMFIHGSSRFFDCFKEDIGKTIASEFGFHGLNAFLSIFLSDSCIKICHLFGSVFIILLALLRLFNYDLKQVFFCFFFPYFFHYSLQGLRQMEATGLYFLLLTSPSTRIQRLRFIIPGLFHSSLFFLVFLDFFCNKFLKKFSKASIFFAALLISVIFSATLSVLNELRSSREGSVDLVIGSSHLFFLYLPFLLYWFKNYDKKFVFPLVILFFSVFMALTNGAAHQRAFVFVYPFFVQYAFQDSKKHQKFIKYFFYTYISVSLLCIPLMRSHGSYFWFLYELTCQFFHILFHPIDYFYNHSSYYDFLLEAQGVEFMNYHKGLGYDFI